MSQKYSLDMYDWKKVLYTFLMLLGATVLTFLQSILGMLVIPDFSVMGITITGIMLQGYATYLVVYLLKRYFSGYTITTPPIDFVN